MDRKTGFALCFPGLPNLVREGNIGYAVQPVISLSGIRVGLEEPLHHVTKKYLVCRSENLMRY